MYSGPVAATRQAFTYPLNKRRRAVLRQRSASRIPSVVRRSHVGVDHQNSGGNCQAQVTSLLVCFAANTVVPRILAATAVHSAPLRGNARCGWPFDNMRTVMSDAVIGSCSPDSIVVPRGGETNPTEVIAAFFWGFICGLSDAHGHGGMQSDRAELSQQLRIPSSNSAPGTPIFSARTKTHVLVASTIETPTSPTSARSRMPNGFPVCSRFPVKPPPGFRKSSRMGCPVSQVYHPAQTRL